MAGDPRITWEGCSVLLDINDGDRLVFARLSPNATVKIGAKKCPLSSLIGCPFGSLFRVDTGPGGRSILTRCAADADAIHERDNLQVKDDHRDNRALVDNNKAQNLSSEDIDAMRREGATGDEIVEALIANSSTFDQKTMFSQEKYKLKKQKKYAPKVLLRRPFCRSICEAYFKKHPARIGFLRMDTLSLLLSMANVSAYSDVLVVDMVGGMLTGAVAERLGGTGYICSTYFGAKSHPLDIVRMFNFNSEVCSRIVQASFSDLCTAQTNKNGCSPLHRSSHSSDIEPTTSIASPSTESVLSEASILNLAGQKSVQEENTIADDIHESNVPAVHKSVNPGKQASPGSISLWKGRGFTSLIIAAPELEVGSMAQELLPLLSYSAPFAIYQQYLEPLATCMHRLQSSKMAINLQISEPWLREYQVLPSRTHPHMQMSAFGGYILSGIRICDNEVCNGNK